MISFAQVDQDTNGHYLQLLAAVAKLSVLFSDSDVPYINYRIAENIFCRSFSARNLGRSDTAFDADYQSVGVGLKTFLCPRKWSFEKVAEFNSVSARLRQLSGKELAVTLAEYRNQRISLAKRLYQLTASQYHIVARRKHSLLLFDTCYEPINTESLRITKKNNSALHFNDGRISYSYNYSKSTLYRDFEVPADAYELPVEIIDNPYDLLLNNFGTIGQQQTEELYQGKAFVVLPLYSTAAKEKTIPERSGLNQWNAGGRKRSAGEIYIPVPARVHQQFPDFFPSRDTPFHLQVPSGEILHAKICQAGGKALMTNPNDALAEWLLRKVLHLAEGELATVDHLNTLGFDSVIIYKDDDLKYRIDIATHIQYSSFSAGFE